MAGAALKLVEDKGMDKQKALETALGQIERNFGKGSIMRLGKNQAMDIEALSTGSLSLGAAYSVSDGVSLTVGFKETNFLGRGQFIKLAVGGSSNSRTYTVSFTEPYLLGSRVSAGFDIQRATREYSAGGGSGNGYDTATQSATVRFGLPITEVLSAQLAYNYSTDSYTCKIVSTTCTGVGQIDKLINDGTWMKSSLSASLTYNTLDNRNDPRNGLFVRGALEYAGIGGDANFIKATATASYYHLLSEDLDMVAVLSAGAGHIYESKNGGIRNSDLFRSSTQIIRGFDSNGIGPYDTLAGQHVGGDTYFKATAEVQFPLPLLPESFGLRGAIFADAATVHGNDLPGSPLVSTDIAFRASAGVGIAWASPFGPLRIDYAIPLQKEATDKVREFSFGVSTRF